MENDIIEKEIKAEEKPEVYSEKVTSKAKQAIAWFIVINLVIIGVLLYLTLNEPVTISSEEISLFYSSTCPHCKNVEDFIENNSLEERLNISQKNVALPNNINEYNSAADICKIPEEERGIPLLYYNGSCYLGDLDAIDFLKQAGGIE
jgi:glutaredoxin